jgi:hypothetical protein
VTNAFKYEHEKKEVFMKAIILARVSSKDQEEGHSLKGQGHLKA